MKINMENYNEIISSYFYSENVNEYENEILKISNPKSKENFLNTIRNEGIPAYCYIDMEQKENLIKNISIEDLQKELLINPSFCKKGKFEDCDFFTKIPLKKEEKGFNGYNFNTVVAVDVEGNEKQFNLKKPVFCETNNMVVLYEEESPKLLKSFKKENLSTFENGELEKTNFELREEIKEVYNERINDAHYVLKKIKELKLKPVFNNNENKNVDLSLLNKNNEVNFQTEFPYRMATAILKETLKTISEKEKNTFKIFDKIEEKLNYYSKNKISPKFKIENKFVTKEKFKKNLQNNNKIEKTIKRGE